MAEHVALRKAWGTLTGVWFLGDTRDQIAGFVRRWSEKTEIALSYEAHHRGQVCMLAHQLGFPLPNEVAYGIWNWENLWKECGSPGGPGFAS
jgi:hypothetical protein